MIHLSVYLYNNVMSLPKDTKHHIIREGIKAITRIALAILGTLIVNRLQLGPLGICGAVLVVAEFSLPITLMTAGFVGRHKIRGAIIKSLLKNSKHSELFAKTHATFVSTLFVAPSLVFAHFPDLSIGYLEEYVIIPFANRVADWAVE